MEIKKFALAYRKHSPKEFYDWLSKGRVMEIRFLNDHLGNKFNNWGLIKQLGEELNLETRYSSIFISDFLHCRKILLYKVNGFPLTRLYNIFISVNPKRKIMLKSRNGLLYKSYYGGIAGTSHVQTILCDIEHIGEREGNATEIELTECLQGASYLVKCLGISSYWINISGNGVHFWFDLEEPIPLPVPTFTEFDTKLKYNLKEEPINSYIKNYNHFIEKLNKMIKEYNPNLKVDEGAKDIARIARPVGSWNIKVNKVARAVGTVVKENQIIKYNNLKYTAAKPLLNNNLKSFKKIKSKSRFHRYNALNLRDSPLYKLFISKLLPSTLSRNHYLEQSFARLLRDNDISLNSVSYIIGEIDSVQQKTIQVDPEYLDDDEPFNAETINNYCFACKLDFVYKILEDVPDIKEGFISEEHYNNLNGYTKSSVFSMSDNISEKPNSYFELKSLIRNLIDKTERFRVFFLLKRLLWDEWEYYDRNKIIINIMNKTRLRK